MVVLSLPPVPPFRSLLLVFFCFSSFRAELRKAPKLSSKLRALRVPRLEHPRPAGLSLGPCASTLAVAPRERPTEKHRNGRSRCAPGIRRSIS